MPLRLLEAGPADGNILCASVGGVSGSLAIKRTFVRKKMMSTILRRYELRIGHARQALELQRRLATTLARFSDDHCKAMKLVFLCEDGLFLQIETRAMIMRLNMSSNRLKVFGQL